MNYNPNVVTDKYMEFQKNNIVDFLNIALETTSGADFGKYVKKVNELPDSYEGLKVKASVGIGGPTYIPWISFTGYNQKTSNGIYPVLLFYKEKSILIIAFGISATNKPKVSWNLPELKTIDQYFKELNISQTKTEKKYNESYVHSVFPIHVDDNKKLDESKLNIDEVFNSINKVCEIFKKHFEEQPMTTIHNENSQNEGFSPIQKIYFGTPGGGKSHKVKTLIEDTKNAKDRYFRTTFHPDTDYASFVGSYKPIMKDELICYEYVPQVFTLAYIAAWNDPDNEYFLDIEEINRGNCAQIFGDLFQLLDRNKKGYSEFPIQADSDLAYYLLNAKDKDGKDILSNKKGIEDKKLCLPPNLSIVATMNTSDQSLFPMDSAFKRRWDWEFVPSTFNEKDNFNITIGNKVYKWHTFLKEANARIKQATDSEDKQMGSYFVKTNMDEDKFKSKVMYYLWSEICKEEYKTQNNFFRYFDQDNNEQEFTFNELYEEGSTKMLQKFMKFMNVSPVDGSNPDEEDKQENGE
jgi:hypothetical protein